MGSTGCQPRRPGGLLAAPIAAWAAVNLHVYGHPVPADEARNLLQPSIPPMAGAPRIVLAGPKICFRTFFAGEPVGMLRFAHVLSYTAGALVLVGAGGRVEGWVELVGVPAGASRLVFGDITTDGYRSVGAVTLPPPAVR